MANFKQDILSALTANKETERDVVAVRITGELDTLWNEEEDPRNAKAAAHKGRLINWQDAAIALDYEYDAGYGSMDCHDVYVWTANYIYYVHEYDGATWVESIDRNPTEVTE